MDEQQPSATSESQKSNLNPLLVVVVLIIIAAVGAMLWLGNSKNTTQAARVVPTITHAQQPTAVVTQASESATVAIAVEGGSYYFKPNEIKAKKGDKVKITFTNAGGFHDFVIDAYNVKTERVASGKSTTVEFVADKVGTFEYYCSVGNHRQMGMTGKLIVSQ